MTSINSIEPDERPEPVDIDTEQIPCEPECGFAAVMCGDPPEGSRFGYDGWPHRIARWTAETEEDARAAVLQSDGWYSSTQPGWPHAIGAVLLEYTPPNADGRVTWTFKLEREWDLEPATEASTERLVCDVVRAANAALAPCAAVQ